MSRKIPSSDPALVAEEIKQIFQSLESRPRKVQLNIPRHLVTVRFLKIPSIDDSEISKIIKIESFKHLPYADENVIYGYRIVEKQEDGYSKVLLAIAQADVIKKYTDILRTAGISGLQYMSLSSEALFSWYMLASEGREKENVMLVNLDSGHIDIDIIETDKLVFTRGVAYASVSSGKTDKIIEQIKISLTTYQKESSNTVNRVILTGGASEASGCRDSLAGELKLPVETMDQMSNMPLSDENVKASEEDVSFAELLGLSLKSAEGIKINLMPEDVREEARLILSKNNLITAVFLTTLFIAVALGLFIKKLHDRDICLKAINTEIKKISPKVDAAKKIAKDIGIIREMMAKKPLAIDILSEVYGITPAGIYLNMLDFESGKSLVIKGTASALGDVFKYVDILEKSQYFESVKVKYANKRMSEGREIADFEIDAALSVLK